MATKPFISTYARTMETMVRDEHNVKPETPTSAIAPIIRWKRIEAVCTKTLKAPLIGAHRCLDFCRDNLTKLANNPTKEAHAATAKLSPSVNEIASDIQAREQEQAQLKSASNVVFNDENARTCLEAIESNKKTLATGLTNKLEKDAESFSDRVEKFGTAVEHTTKKAERVAVEVARTAEMVTGQPSSAPIATPSTPVAGG